MSKTSSLTGRENYGELRMTIRVNWRPKLKWGISTSTVFNPSLTHRLTMLVAFVLLMHQTADAQRGLNPKSIPPPDPKEQIKTLIPAEGFEINLFAADPMIASPIQMNWDASGRLWVASSSVYPQIKPGQKADDKIVILEDTNGDGRADKRIVFADELLIPTAVIPGDGGAYIAHSTELLHLADTDGDSRADKETVVLSGFGTEDTHHIIHTLRWGPAQMLYCNQSIYIHSHLETPWGVRRLGGGGTWQLQPQSLKLQVVMRGCVNPWGRHWNRWGASFATDGAYGDGICYTFPGATFPTAPGAKATIRGLNPGQPKMCGLEVLSGRHLPESWRGRMISNDFRGHRTASFVLQEADSGFVSRRAEDLIRSSHLAFRPIDIKMGPDGAIYIADWYNPIIQHGEVDFRDPRRDHAHGRIWRVTAKGRPLVKPPKLVAAPIGEILDALKLPEQWTRTQAKRVLAQRGAKAVAPPLRQWLAALSSEDEQFEHDRLEALWTFQAIDVVDAKLLRAVLQSTDHRARASAVRVLSHWHDRVDGSIDLLASAVADRHPRVRLEAVCALNVVGTPQAYRLCLDALNHSVDKFIEHALRIALLGRGSQGSLVGARQFPQLLFRLEFAEDAAAIDPLLKMVDSGRLTPAQTDRVFVAVSQIGGPQHLAVVFERILAAAPGNPPGHIGLLKMLAHAAIGRNAKPNGDLNRLAKLFGTENRGLRVAALQLAGAWRLQPQRAALKRVATEGDEPTEIRIAAIAALAGLGGADSIATLERLIYSDLSLPVRSATVIGLAQLDVRPAATGAAKLMSELPGEADPGDVIAALLQHKEGTKHLADAVRVAKLKPDVAKLAVRAVERSGRNLPELISAFRTAGSLAAARTQWSDKELRAFVDDVGSKGNPTRGELIYRRQTLGCVKCHAIGGAGGRVGPDLVSIGASAQVDYLIESLLDPNKKIKENFHSLVVETNGGRLLTGINIGRTNRHLILRDAENREMRIPLTEIAEEENGASLMPAGLVDSLTRGELTDLVAFLSQLGKEGPFSIGQRRWVRHWEVVAATEENLDYVRRTGVSAAADSSESLAWAKTYSLVSGNVPLAGVPVLTIPARKLKTSILRFRLEVTSPGKVQLNSDSIAAAGIWVDGSSLEPRPAMQIDLEQGVHTVTVAVDRNKSNGRLQVELVEVTDSPAGVQLLVD
ncbi:MAG: PVC-type heme-binding CxxCH protein [Pirellulales bacterium]